MEDVSPEVVRARDFSIARRGYDRGEVDDFKVEVAEVIASLRADIDRLAESMQAAGFDRPRDLASELDTAADELRRILQEARAVAEQMRSRAAADAAKWRADADADAKHVTAEAQSAAQQARQSAWDEGTSMLEEASTEHSRLLEEAAQEALFIRAEAEREALRLIGDAKRDRDEELRRARDEADRLVTGARQEADTVLVSARRQAEAAQERAKALEDRRAELMTELEAARTSIGEFEDEIETKRGDQEQEEDAVDTSSDVEPESPRWTGDEASVKIVSGARAVRSTPVDALAMAAEVEALQQPPLPAPSSEAVKDVAADPEPEPEADPDGKTVGEASSPPTEPVPEGQVEEEPVSEAQPDAEEEQEAEPTVDEVGPAAEPEPEDEPADDAIADLFASLRQEPEPRVTELERRAAEAPEEAQATADEGDPAALGPVVTGTVVATQESPGAEVEGDRSALDVRDRLLLPVQNRALRSIKRRIVDLQNRALEELRLDSAWRPDSAFFVAAFVDDLVSLARESVVAGYAAAADLTGGAETPHPEIDDVGDAAPEFSAALAEAVTHSLETATSSDAGDRERASGVSKVFRAWRTDEAERRLRVVAFADYHRGLLAGLGVLGVERVVGVPSGRRCSSCPADQSWSTTGEPPSGTVIPPAEVGCVCTLAPAGANPSAS